MRRIPLGGLFLAACLGIGAAEPGVVPPAAWACAFTLSAIAVLFRQHTLLTLTAVLCFFGSWQSFRRTTDLGYQLSANPAFLSRFHQFTLEADTDSKPFHWANRIRQRLLATVTTLDSRPARFRVEAQLPGAPIDYGDLLRVQGRLTLPGRALNPGEFDDRAYLQQQGVYLTLICFSPRQTSLLHHGWGNPLQAIALRWRKAIQPIPTRSLENDPPIKALIDGITFGDRSGFSPDLLNVLQDTGTLHLFVIDGLKVTLLAGVSWLAARFVCLPRRWIAAIVVPFLVLYCAATGLSSAGLRATLMALFVLLGVSLEKPVVQLNAWSGSGVILLTWNPEELFQLGFQLSFTIVALIVTAAHPLSSLLSRPFRFDPWIPPQLIRPARRFRHRIIQRSAELLAVCFICWIASLPFSIFYFHRVSLNNVIANFLAVPIGTWILFTALGSILICPVSGWASVCLNNSNWLLGHLLIVVVNGAAAIPGQATNVSLEAWSANPRIVVLASGRSETVYFRTGAINGLINPGSPAKYRRITEPFLRSQGINELGFLSWSKPDTAHCGAAAEIVKQFPLNSARAAPGPPSLSCSLGPFQFLFLGGNRREDAREPGRVADVVLATGPRQISAAELVTRFHPQAILYAEGRSGGKETLPGLPPVWFLPEKGAVTLTLHNNSLELKTHLGDHLTLRPRRSTANERE